MGYLIVAIVWGIVWGVVVNQVIKNKGYEENWFFWGFFFSFFALVVALTKPDAYTVKAAAEPVWQTKKAKKKEILVTGVCADKVDICSPVHIVSWEIQKENDSELILYIKFCNRSESTISAVLFSAFGFNSFGDKISVSGEESFDVIGQDLSVKPGEFGDIQMKLPDSGIRKVEVRTKKVCLSDRVIEESNTSRWIATNQKPLSSKYLECAYEKNPKGKFHAIIENDYWQCVCGFVNTGEICCSCQMRKKAASEFTEENIESTYRKYLEEIEEKERREEQEREKRAEEAKLRQKKKKKYAGICVAAGCAVVIAISAYNQKIQKEHYDAESSIISHYMEREECEDAYRAMISSDMYLKLKEEYGEALWKQQAESDQKFKERGLMPTWEKEYLVYNDKSARGGICYYEYFVKTEDKRVVLLGVLENGDIQELCMTSDPHGEEYKLFCGLGHPTWGGSEDDEHDIAWSNGWIFVTATDGYGHLDERYAIKYDEKKKEVYTVDLLSDFDFDSFFKMKDGNILFCSGELEDMEEAINIALFDVLDGTVKELTYEEVVEIYGDMEENILTVYE